MSVVYLVETEEHAVDLINRKKEEDTMLIALTPFAMHAFEKNNIKYNIPEDFYSEGDLWQVGLDSCNTVNQICSRLDNFAMDNSEGLKKSGLKLYTNYNYPLYVLFDTIFGRIFQLKSILKHLKPSKVYCYKTEKYPPYWRGVGFDSRELLFSRILEDCGWQEEINFISNSQIIGKSPHSGSSLRDFNYSLGQVKKYIKNKFTFLSEIKNLGLSGFINKAVLSVDCRRNIALLGGEYEWEECQCEFIASGLSLKKIKIEHDERGYQLDDDEIEKKIHNEVKDLLVFMQIDITKLILPRLAFIYYEGQRRCIRAFNEAERQIDRLKPRALLFSSLATPEWKSAAAAFMGKSIPTFCKSHGAVIAFELSKILDNELLYAKYYFTNSDEAVKLYHKYADRSYSKDLTIINTGSPKLQRLKNRKGKPHSRLKQWLKEKNSKNYKKVGLYVTTLYLQNFLYYCWQPAWSDNSLFKTQKTIIDFLKNRDDSLLVWKLHPNRLLDRPPHIETGASNIFVIRDEVQFIDLLDFVDFVIIDMPATTCTQVVTKKLPVFIVTKHLSYFPEAKEKLQKRAVCCGEPEDLMIRVNDFLTNGMYDADINNDEFMNTYGTSTGSFDAVKKTVLEVKKAINA